MIDPERRLLSPGERRMVGFALGLLALVGSIVLFVVSFRALGRLVGMFSLVLWPLALSGILALMLRPVVGILGRILHITRSASVGVLFGLVILAVGALLLNVVPVIISQVLDFIDYLPELWRKGALYVQENYPEWIELWQRQMEKPSVRDAVHRLALEARDLLNLAIPGIREAGQLILKTIGTAVAFSVVPIYLYFFLRSGDDPTRPLPQYLPFLDEDQRNDVLFLIREFLAIIITFFRGQLLIGLIMGLLLALGFTLIGLRFGLLIGLVLGFLNIVPYLGTIIGLAIALPLALLQPDGGWTLVWLTLLVFAVVQLVEGWLLTPNIMGRRTGLHPVTVIIAIFFWGTALHGILGMILAIPLTAFFVTVWRWAKQKYFQPVPPAPPSPILEDNA